MEGTIHPVVSPAGSHYSSIFPDFIRQISVLFGSPFGQEKIRARRKRECWNIGMMENWGDSTLVQLWFKRFKVPCSRFKVQNVQGCKR
jgi:hypothetical protein